MDSNTHIIRQQVFELDFTSRAGSHELQNKFSRFFYNYLLEGMEQLFERLIPHNRTIRIDQLRINAGTVPYHWVDQELADAILLQLEQELKLILLHDNSAEAEPEPGENQDQAVTYLNLLEYYLLRGILPWWAGGEQLADPAKALDYLLAHAPQQLAALITRVGQHAFVRQRLVYQFSEQQVRGIVQVLEPAEAVFIFGYHTEVAKIQQRDQLVKAEQTEFEKAVWVFILTYLLVDRGTHFNRKHFVRSNINSLAARYSLSFRKLLSLFAAALKPATLSYANTDALQAIILEISIEENTTTQTGPSPGEPEKSTELQTLGTQLNVLRYYLGFGSFPWWSGYLDKDELSVLLSAMIARVPKTIEAMIRDLGKSGLTRTLLVRTFKEDILKQVITLLEPDHAGFIIDYVAEAKTVHTQKTVIQVGADELAAAIWEFILEFLLVDRGSEFNRKMFVQSNIRKLGNRFNISYGELIVFMVQRISAARQESAGHFSLLQVLTTLYRERTPADSAIQPRGSSPGREGSQPERPPGVRKVTLKNTLYFWLKLGYLPWWADEYAGQSPAALFETFLQQSPADAVILLKHAGTKLFTRRRMIFQLPMEVLVRLFSLVLPAHRVNDLFHQLTALIYDNGKIKFREHDTIRYLLLSSLWNVFIGTDYQRFDEEAFVAAALTDLSLWSGVAPEQLTVALDRGLPPKHRLEWLKKIYQQAQEGKDDSSPAIQSATRTGKETTGETTIPALILPGETKTQAITRLINRYIAEGQPAQLTKNKLIEEAFSLLSHFIRYQRFPEKYKEMAGLPTDLFFKQLLKFLQTERPVELQRFIRSLEDAPYPPDPRDTLYSLIREGYSKISGEERKTPDNQRRTVPDWMANPDIEQLILRRLTSGSTQGENPSKDDVVREAVRILRYFLQHKKLPERYKIPAALAIDQFLKQLFIFIYRADPAELEKILAASDAVAEHFLHVHEIFSITTSPLEANVSQLLTGYLEKNILLYIAQSGVRVTENKSLTTIIDRYLKQAGSPKGRAFLAKLFSYPVVSVRMAQYYGEETVFSLWRGGALTTGWGNQTLPELQAFQEWLSMLLPDRLDRDQASLLFRTFGFMMMGEAIRVNTPQEYLHHFFRFIADRHYQLMLKIAFLAQKAIGKKKAGDLLLKLLPQIRQELKPYQASGQFIRQLDRQMETSGLADENAIHPTLKKIREKEEKQLKKEVQDEQRQTREEKEEPMKNGESVYINNAGLVLLHPFLAVYFSRLEILEKGDFVSEEARHRAVHLLQYLVSGVAATEEHELVLNKILCNIPLEEPVPAGIELTEKEKTISAELLAAVLTQWDKLKNTSAESLQISFLQRRGSLTKNEDSWSLRVEQRGYDVLLQTLPWGLGMIKTSWMTNFIYVEWI